MSDDINDFLFGSGGKAFPFEKMGDQVTGEIIGMKKQQQTEPDSGKPKFFDSGDPMMMIVVTLQTDLHDDDEDDGVRNVYLRAGKYVVADGKGSAGLVAVRDAVKRSGSDKGIEVGGRLTLAYTGHGPKKGAFNPAKLYTASYKPAVSNIDLEEMV